MKEVTLTQTTLDKNQYMAIMDRSGEHLIAFISPAKGVNPTTLVNQLQAKGLNAVINTKNTTEAEFEL